MTKENLKFAHTATLVQAVEILVSSQGGDTKVDISPDPYSDRYVVRTEAPSGESLDKFAQKAFPNARPHRRTQRNNG